MDAPSVADKLDQVLLGQGTSVPGLDNAEKFFDALGLGQGTFAPYGRFAFGFLATAGLQKLAGQAGYAGWAYEHGQARPWARAPGLLDESAGTPTEVPWFLIPFAVGTVCGVFI
jgi:hypothetical protein